MYVNVRRFKIAPGSADKIRNEVQQNFLPIVSKIPGFTEYFFLNVGNNEMMSINIFENRAGAEESVQRAADFVKKNLSSLVPNPPEVVTGEVVVHHGQVAGRKVA